jgi:Ca2+-binding RTX toxin-like protein
MIIQEQLVALQEPQSSILDTSQVVEVAPQLTTTESSQLQVLERVESGLITKSANNIFLGTPNSDTINGTARGDIISSLEGDDTVYGQGGNDIIGGGGGSDYIEGNAGRDIIYGDYTPSGNSDLIASGNDTINGGDGNDLLYGQDGEDIIFGDLGSDYAEGGAGNDTINGGSGNDILYGDDIEDNPGISGNDIISGGIGNDYAEGGKGNDILKGDAGIDSLFGGQGNDTLDGGTGNDILAGTDTAFFGQLQNGFGFGEVDTLIGGRSNDTFVLGLGEANARDVNGNNTVVFDVVLYNDGNVNANGAQDYALIKDFGFLNDGTNRGFDRVQLAGSQSMYSLGTFANSSISGAGIFFTQDQVVPELIGVLEGISLANLSLSNTNQFLFV